MSKVLTFVNHIMHNNYVYYPHKSRTNQILSDQYETDESKKPWLSRWVTLACTWTMQPGHTTTLHSVYCNLFYLTS